MSRRALVHKVLTIVAVGAVGTSTAPCASPASAEAVIPTITEVGPDYLDVAWPEVVGATQVQVIVGSEPARTRGGALAGAVCAAKLPGSARTHRLEKLAPNVDVFVRVEVQSPNGPRAGNVHARTRLGGRAAGDEQSPPVREVSALAPNVLRIVVRAEEGRAYDNTRWRITRRNGKAIDVRDSHRQSVPVRQPAYRIGFRAADDLSVVEADHRIFLVLGEPIGTRDVLRIRGPRGVEMLLPFSDRYLETPVVQLNQVGYNPRATARFAYVSGWMGDGGPLALADFPAKAQALRENADPLLPRAVAVAELPITDRAQNDGDAGSPVREIDLAKLPASEDAVYRVRVPGVGVSYPTQVSELAAFKAFYVAARGLFHNRWGGDLNARYTEWSRPADHPFVFTANQADAFTFFAQNTPQQGRRPLRGGYHDAGDFDQRPMHTVVAQVLLRAYEHGPDRFTDGQLLLPESGNGVPDLLDEALWGVAGWEALQEEDGGVRAGVESYRHPWGIYAANDDGLVYWTFARDPGVTARVAGLFAQSARLLERFDRPRARRLRDRAVRAWNWARQHQARPEYALYATGELFRLTGEERYRTQFEDAWRSIGPYGAFNRFANAHLYQGDYSGEGRVMPDFLIGYLRATGADRSIIETSETWIGREADTVGRSVLGSEHAHRNARAGRPLGWGQSTVMGRYLDPIIGYLGFADVSAHRRQAYFDAMSVAADYVLGANPLGFVFLTGLGSRSPQEPLHLDSLVYVQRGKGPMPGIPVYGPVEDLPQADYQRHGLETFYPRLERLPPLLRYADLRSLPAMNECTIWECQAPHVEHFAMLLGPGMAPPDSWRPGAPDHRNPLPTRGPRSHAP